MERRETTKEEGYHVLPVSVFLIFISFLLFSFDVKESEIIYAIDGLFYKEINGKEI